MAHRPNASDKRELATSWRAVNARATGEYSLICVCTYWKCWSSGAVAARWIDDIIAIGYILEEAGTSEERSIPSSGRTLLVDDDDSCVPSKNLSASILPAKRVSLTNCELCEHCQSPIFEEDNIMIRDGFSYHQQCHKCYVCSETNLANAEVFKGVIFCSCCAQRIFQGCSTARRTKTMHSSKGKRIRHRSRRRGRDRVKGDERTFDDYRDGVIERAKLVGSNTDSEDQQEQKAKKPSKSAIPGHMFQGKRNEHVETVGLKKSQLPEIGTTTDVTQELLKKISSIQPKYTEKPRKPPVAKVSSIAHVAPKRERERHIRRKDINESDPTCCDLRIAELGMSTEIANMALRKNSEGAINIGSDTRYNGKTQYTVSLIHLKSDKSDEDLRSAYSTINECRSLDGSLMDRRLGSILKMPIKLFKKKILNRSSLVSVLMSTENGRSIHILRELKRLLHEEVVDHQVRGIKQLYSTINRSNRPYKLGWVNLATKVSRDSNFCCCSYGARCKHFKGSHSYRCMRAQVMKLAGPTNSELAIFRSKIIRFIAPKIFRNIVTNCKTPAIKISAACQKSCTIKA